MSKKILQISNFDHKNQLSTRVCDILILNQRTHLEKMQVLFKDFL